MAPSDEPRVTEESPLLHQPHAYVDEGAIVDHEDHHRARPKSAVPLGAIRGWCLVFSLGALIFLQTSNISLLTTIQGPIAEDLNAYEHTSWFATTYLIAMSSITPLAGRLCQSFRLQSYILTSSILLALGLAVTSTAPGLPLFLVGRVITGIGTGGNFPVALNLIVDLTSTKRRGLFMGLLNTGFTIGVAFGAVFAGLLEPIISWRGVFGIQIPVAIVAGVSLYSAMPSKLNTADEALLSQPLRKKIAGVDYLGVVTLVPFIVLLLFGLSSPSRIVWEALVLSIPFLTSFIFVEAYHARNPIIPVTLLKSRATLTTCFATLLLMTSRWALVFYTPMYAIAVRSWQPAKAGTVLISINGGFAMGGLLAGWLHIRRAGSFYLSAIITLLLFAASMFLLGETSTATSSIPIYFSLTFINGLATGAALNYNLVHLLHLTDPSTHFIATSLVATFRGFAGSFGTSIGGGVFQRVLRKSLTTGFAKHGLDPSGKLTAKLMGSARLVQTLVGEERAIATQGYTDAVRILFFTGTGVVVAAAIVQACTGWRAFTEEEEEYPPSSNGHAAP